LSARSSVTPDGSVDRGAAVGAVTWATMHWIVRRPGARRISVE
jgi:hypothetical protein